MIEVVLDGNDNNEFCDKVYPVIRIDNICENTWEEYRQIAKKIISENPTRYALILRSDNKDISLNKMALAFFVESITVSNDIEYVVFKVSNLIESREKYKPYIALSIALKYALNLANETPNVIFKNISELGYLGVQTQRNYSDNTMVLSLPNSTAKPFVMTPKNIEETLCAVAVLKALSVGQFEVNAQANIKILSSSETINKTAMVDKIIKDVSPWIN